jgi:hypothetical protein
MPAIVPRGKLIAGKATHLQRGRQNLLRVPRKSKQMGHNICQKNYRHSSPGASLS